MSASFILLSILTQIISLQKIISPEDLDILLKSRDQFLLIGYLIGIEEQSALVELFKNQSEVHFEYYFVLKKQLNSFQKKDILNQDESEVILYISGYPKIYKGDLEQESFDPWLINILKAVPMNNDEFMYLAPSERDYFIYSKESYLKRNQQEMEILTRLSYPIPVVFGSNQKKLNLPINDQDLFAFRKYDKKII